MMDSAIGVCVNKSFPGCVTASFKFVVFREVLVFYGNESVSDIGADIFAEWGVVPEYVVPLSAFWLLVVGGS